MAYDPEELVRLRHLLQFGERFLTITDWHEERIVALENGGGGGGGINILYNTKAHWDANPRLIPAAGTIIIYSDYASVGDAAVPNFKVADGKAYLADLPFCNDDLRAVVAAHIANQSIHLDSSDREKLENSVTVNVEHQSENNYRIVLS